MAYILIFSIFLPSLNNNTIFIFSSHFIKHTHASFFKFLCICATESLPGIYKPLELSQIIQSSTCSCPDNTSSRLVSTSPPPASGCPCPDEKRPFLLCVYQVTTGFLIASQPCPALSVPPRDTVPDRKSALPCSVHAIKMHQTLIASQHRHLLDSIVFTLDWCSYCTPQAGTVTKSYCMPQAGTLTNSDCTPQAGTVTKSYCTPPAGILTNSYCTPQAGTVTNSYCMPLAGTVTHSSCMPQAGIATNKKKNSFVFLFCYPNKSHSVLCNLLLK